MSSDIDYETSLVNGFEITFGSSQRKVNGNRLLLNRFEMTLLTKHKRFETTKTEEHQADAEAFFDNYGGDASKFIDKPQVLNQDQAISAAITLSIQQTVDSMQGDEPVGILNTEKIKSASLKTLDIVDGIITAIIEVIPVEAEPYKNLLFRLPIIKRV